MTPPVRQAPVTEKSCRFAKRAYAQKKVYLSISLSNFHPTPTPHNARYQNPPPENQATCRPTSPTVTSRPYHTAPAEAGREEVNLKAGPQAREIPEPQPAARADSRGTTTAEEGKRSDVSEEEEVAGERPESGGWTEDSSVSKAHVCSLILFGERNSQFRSGARRHKR